MFSPAIGKRNASIGNHVRGLHTLDSYLYAGPRHSWVLLFKQGDEVIIVDLHGKEVELSSTKSWLHYEAPLTLFIIFQGSLGLNVDIITVCSLPANNCAILV